MKEVEVALSCYDDSVAEPDPHLRPSSASLRQLGLSPLCLFLDKEPGGEVSDDGMQTPLGRPPPNTCQDATSFCSKSTRLILSTDGGTAGPSCSFVCMVVRLRQVQRPTRNLLGTSLAISHCFQGVYWGRGDKSADQSIPHDADYAHHSCFLRHVEPIPLGHLVARGSPSAEEKKMET